MDLDLFFSKVSNLADFPKGYKHFATITKEFLYSGSCFDLQVCLIPSSRYKCLILCCYFGFKALALKGSIFSIQVADSHPIELN